MFNRQRAIFPANRPVPSLPFQYDQTTIEFPIFPATEAVKYFHPITQLPVGTKSYDYTTGEATTWDGKNWINAMGIKI